MALAQQTIERDSPVPLYYQLKQLLDAGIDGGEWKPGDLMPGEQDLQDMFGLSRTTVRQALRELEVEGRVTRYRGKGTFVSQPKLSHGPEPKQSLSDTLAAAGLKPGWHVLSTDKHPAPDDVAARLGITAGTKIHRIERLRLVNDEPIGHLVSWIAPTVAGPFTKKALSDGGSLDYLRAKDVLDGATADRVIDAVAATPEQARLLDIEPGAPMLRITRIVTAADGTALEDFSGTYRADRFQYQLGTTPVTRGEAPSGNVS